MTTQPNDQSHQSREPAYASLRADNPVPAANDAPHSPAAESSTEDQAEMSSGGEVPEHESMEEAAPRTAPLSEDRVRDEIRKVIDPELYVNIVDLGLVYVVDLVPNPEDADITDISIQMTMTSPMCPAGPQLVDQTRSLVEAMDGVGLVDIKVVMDPPWTPDLMTEDARDQLGIF